MKKKIWILCCTVLFIIIVLSIYISTDNFKLKNLNYSNKTIKLINEENITKKVLDKGYSKTLETALINNDFDYNNFDLYYNFRDIDNDDYIKKLNILSKLGYSINDIKLILKKISFKDIDYITNNVYISNLKDYLSFNNFDITRLNRYINYKNLNSDLNMETIILNVNMDFDKTPYEDYNIVSNVDDIKVLVNKFNRLPDNYEPNDLSKIDKKYSSKELYLRNVACVAFNKMCSDALSLGLKIIAVSSYRDREYQESLYNNYSIERGQDIADNFSARPRFSEHETGLSIDIMGSNEDYNKFSSTDEYKWLEDNAYKYGFIIRYPKGKEDITKYIYEAWHIRYVGEDNAKYIYDNKITLEEFLALQDK